MFNLEGKVAIVTGATSGIGVAIAEKFVEAGAKVVVAGRRKAEGYAVAKNRGTKARFQQTDVTDEAQMKALIADALSAFGRLDCIVNNAGGPGPVGSLTWISASPILKERMAMPGRVTAAIGSWPRMRRRTSAAASALATNAVM